MSPNQLKRKFESKSQIMPVILSLVKSTLKSSIDLLNLGVGGWEQCEVTLKVGQKLFEIGESVLHFFLFLSFFS